MGNFKIMRVLTSLLIVALLVSESSAIRVSELADCCPEKKSCEVKKECGCSSKKAAKEEDDDEEAGEEVEKAIEKVQKKKDNKEAVKDAKKAISKVKKEAEKNC